MSLLLNKITAPLSSPHIFCLRLPSSLLPIVTNTLSIKCCLHMQAITMIFVWTKKAKSKLKYS